MTKLSASQAAKEVGKSVPTITRAIKSGKLSASKLDGGGYEIDPSELFRVFQPVKDETKQNPKMLGSETPQKNNSDRMLQGEVDALRDQLAALNIEREREREQFSDTIEDLRQRLDKSEDERRDMSQRLLPAPEKATERPKGLLGWFGTRRG